MLYKFGKKITRKRGWEDAHKQDRIKHLKNKILDELFDTQFIPVMVGAAIAIIGLYIATTNKLNSNIDFQVAATWLVLAVVAGLLLRYVCHTRILEIELEELEVGQHK